MMDWQRQERIKKFLGYDPFWDSADCEPSAEEIAELLLRFEHFLLHCETERQKR
jgi:hypothetical protein